MFITFSIILLITNLLASDNDSQFGMIPAHKLLESGYTLPHDRQEPNVPCSPGTDSPNLTAAIPMTEAVEANLFQPGRPTPPRGTPTKRSPSVQNITQPLSPQPPAATKEGVPVFFRSSFTRQPPFSNLNSFLNSARKEFYTNGSTSWTKEWIEGVQSTWHPLLREEFHTSERLTLKERIAEAREAAETISNLFVELLDWEQKVDTALQSHPIDTMSLQPLASNLRSTLNNISGFTDIHTNLPTELLQGIANKNLQRYFFFWNKKKFSLKELVRYAQFKKIQVEACIERYTLGYITIRKLEADKKRYTELARLDEPNAMFHLALIYQNEAKLMHPQHQKQEKEELLIKASKLYKSASDLGNMYASNHYALLLLDGYNETGLSVASPETFQKAAMCLTTAGQKITAALNNLGTMIEHQQWHHDENGHVISEESRRDVLIRIYSRASKAGDVVAARNLALLLAQHNGILK